MNIIITGAPGSGKGTQAELLAEKLNLHYFQTGKFSRDLAKKDKKIKKIIDAGKLIPEGLMTEYVLRYLDDTYPEGTNMLLEGYPRFISQYEELRKWFNSKGKKLNNVISLDISEDVAIKRISSRRICEGCGEIYNLITNPPPKDGCSCGGKLVQREDDKPESIKVRFEYYKNNTKKMIDYADKKGELIRIDGERSIDEIHKDIMSRLS